jgi:hypothetical protein
MDTILSQAPTLPMANRVRLMKQALQTAVDMVPDEGPWIVHADCHLGNVLLGGGQAVLSDWGRTVIIENPADIGSVRKGVKEWLVSIEWLGLTPIMSNGRFITALVGSLHSPREYPQHPHVVLDDIGLNLFMADVSKQETARQAIRGWLVYVLVAQAFGIQHPAFLTTTSQSDLQAKLDATLASTELPTVALPPSASTGGMYGPTKYFRGLTRRQNQQRKRSATRRTKMSFKNPKAYVPFKSDKGVKTRRSSYTSKFRSKYPDAKTLPEIAKATGIPKSILDQVYDRGMAAWRTGHRPGASQQAWGMARVHSFVMKGKTWRTADADLARKV